MALAIVLLNTFEIDTNYCVIQHTKHKIILNIDSFKNTNLVLNLHKITQQNYFQTQSVP